jgi:hypothetical protein
MPYWSIYCVICSGFIRDALLECVPAARRSEPAYLQLFTCKPGAALACPFCGGFLGFGHDGKPMVAEPGWPVFRYGRAQLETKRDDDGEPASLSLMDWALKHRFQQPGTHLPFGEFTYAEQAPTNETVP